MSLQIDTQIKSKADRHQLSSYSVAAVRIVADNERDNKYNEHSEFYPAMQVQVRCSSVAQPL